MKITSLNNDKVSHWAKLKMKKFRDIEHLFIVESEHLVEEALKKGIVKEIITTEEVLDDSIPVYQVTSEIMKRITSLVTPPKIMAVCSHIMPDDIEGNVLLIDHLQDPGNLGTIIRSAVAFDFKTIIVSNDTVDVYNDKVIRSSEGMIFNINIIKDDLRKMIPLLKDKGYYIIGTDVKKGHNIKEFKNHKCAFVIGNEGAGMSLDIKEVCDAFVYIKMNSSCESLNAAVASSIIMYEIAN
ncbi:MAG: RNA methyltransferase [Firmicutes bacterium]|nr:RNA methyltransferase [Bacillota bacterium]